MNEKYRIGLWLAFFIFWFGFLSNSFNYVSNLTTGYRDQNGAHVPTFSNTPVPMGLIFFGCVEILLIILIVKNIRSERKKNDSVQIDQPKGTGTVQRSPFFKATGLFLILAVVFFMMLMIGLSG